MEPQPSYDPDENAEIVQRDFSVVGKNDQLDRIEAKLDAILGIMQEVGEQVEQFQGIIGELEDSPAGNMLFNMLGIRR